MTLQDDQTRTPDNQNAKGHVRDDSGLGTSLSPSTPSNETDEGLHVAPNPASSSFEVVVDDRGLGSSDVNLFPDRSSPYAPGDTGDKQENLQNSTDAMVAVLDGLFVCGICEKCFRDKSGLK